MLLIAEVMTEEICHPIHRYPKSTIKYINDCDQRSCHKGHFLTVPRLA